MTESWSIDDLGIVSTIPARVLFYIGSVRAIVKIGYDEMDICFEGFKIMNQFTSKADRDKIFILIGEWVKEYKQQMRKH